MAGKVRYGIVGCGGIATQKHMLSIRSLGAEAEMVAFCDLMPERAESANLEFGSGKGFVTADYKELIKRDLDVVCVLTPNISHCEITVAALKAGKHVMCEKPMAMNYAEAQRMIKARDESGKLLSIGYQNRYRADSMHLKRICEAGELGDIYFARAIAVRRRAVPTWGVFLDGEKQGGGPLIDIGTHALDLTLYAMNNYEPAYCVGTTYHKLNNDKEAGNAWGDWDPSKFTVEDSAFGYVVMKNGASIMLSASWALNTLDVREAVTELCGTKAGADMPREGVLRINGVKHGRQYTTEPSFAAGGVAFYGSGVMTPADIEAATFLNAVKGKGKLTVTAEQAAAVTRILEGLYISAKTGKQYTF